MRLYFYDCRNKVIQTAFVKVYRIREQGLRVPFYQNSQCFRLGSYEITSFQRLFYILINKFQQSKQIEFMIIFILKSKVEINILSLNIQLFLNFCKQITGFEEYQKYVSRDVWKNNLYTCIFPFMVKNCQYFFWNILCIYKLHPKIVIIQKKMIQKAYEVLLGKNANKNNPKSRQLKKEETSELLKFIQYAEEQEKTLNIVCEVMKKIDQFESPEIQKQTKRKVPFLESMINFHERHISHANVHHIMNYSENKDLKTWEKLGVCLDDLKETDNILKNIEKIISYFQTEIKQQESLTFTKGWSSKITGEQYNQNIENKLKPLYQDYFLLNQINKNCEKFFSCPKSNSTITWRVQNNVKALFEIIENKQKQISCNIQNKKYTLESFLTVIDQLKKDNERIPQLQDRISKLQVQLNEKCDKIPQTIKQKEQELQQIQSIYSSEQKRTSKFRQLLREIVQSQGYSIGQAEETDEDSEDGNINLRNSQKFIIKSIRSIIERNLMIPSNLIRNNSEKEFVLRSIQKYTDNQITGCNIIYNHKSKLSPKEALSQRTNTILILQTENQRKIVGYSSRSYCNNVDKKQTKGLLINVNDRKQYKLKAGRLPNKYDPSHIVFGSQQIRLFVKQGYGYFKTQSSSAFELGEDNWTKITKLQQNKINIKGFQVYELQFKNKEDDRKKQPTKVNINTQTVNESRNIQKPKMGKKSNATNYHTVGVDTQKKQLQKKVNDKEKVIRQQNEKIQKFMMVEENLKKSNQFLKQQLKKSKRQNPNPQVQTKQVIFRDKIIQKPLQSYHQFLKIKKKLEECEDKLRQQNESKSKRKVNEKEQQEHKNQIKALQQVKILLSDQLKQLKESEQRNHSIQDQKHKEWERKVQKIHCEKQELLKEITDLKKQLERRDKEAQKNNINFQKLSYAKEALQTQIKEMNDRLYKKQNIIKSITDSSETKENETQQLIIENEKLKSQIQQYQEKYASLQKLDSQLSATEATISKKSEELEDKRLKIDSLQQDIQEQKKSQEGIRKQLNTLGQNFILKKNNLTKLQQEIVDYQLQKKTFEISMKGCQQKVSALNNEIREKGRQIQHFRTEVSQLQTKVKERNISIKKKDQWLREQSKKLQELNKSQQTLQQLKKNIQDSKNQLNMLKALKLQISQNNEMKVKDNVKLDQQIIKKIDELKKKIKQIQDKDIEINQKKKIVEQKEQQLKYRETIILQKEQVMKNSMLQVKTVSYRHLFPGKIFSRAVDEKKYLISELQNITKKQIQYTKVLYTYPYNAKIDFHQYIDKKENYVVVIKLNNGNILAAYSVQALEKGVENNGQGFISELTKKTIFFLKKTNPKAKISLYNEFYLSFGNAELRIKKGDKLVTSNLGTTYKYFDTGKEKDPTLLFGHPQRQAQLSSYQIHQVKYRKE